MPFYKFGIILKKRRHELGYTQEDLADGICAVNTLSRYENGERLPTKTHMEMLLQRLGYSDTIFDLYVDDRTFALHELKFSIRQAFILNQFDRAKELLVKYKNLSDQNSCVSQQFIILCQTTLNQEMSAEKKLSELERAIKLTCPEYDRNKLPPMFSYEEIIILNHIAVRQYERGNLSSAIEILSKINRFYESDMVNTEEILRTQTMILYNLSKYLGCAAKYEECIEICNLGIRIARETGRCNYLSWMFYNKAWALSRKNQAGDMEAAKEALRLAYSMADIMDDMVLKNHITCFSMKTFGDPNYCANNAEGPSH